MKRKVDYKKLEIIVLVFLIIAFAIIAGLNKSGTAYFNPTNGTYQNYNPVRRLLAGQVPFRDFAVYLGTGHLYSLSFFQLILGNTYIKSVFIANMLTFLLYELAVFLISYLLFRNKKTALCFTVGGGVINLIRPNFLSSLLGDNYVETLNFGLYAGNSARLIRNIIPFLLVLLLIIGLRFFNKSKNSFIKKNKQIIIKSYWAFLGGLAILWSNDGGIATYIASSFIYFLLLIKESNKSVKYVIKYTLFYIGVSLLTLLLALVIVTQGSVMSWFKFTLGASSYQKWYFGLGPNKINTSLYTMIISIYQAIMFLVIIYYLYKMFKAKNNEETMRYSYLSIICLSSIGSSYLYMLISGSNSMAMLSLILYVLLICYVVKFLAKLIKKDIFNKIKIVMLMLALAAFINSGWQCLRNMKLTHLAPNSEYVKDLGGYISKYGESVKEAKQIIKDDKIFSTYATAIEDATKQFQPTGSDYIIHCLGDEQREEYVKVFNEGNFKYVMTMDRDEIYYRNWIRNANWFFYKELYKDYVPYFATEYSAFWQKRNDNYQVDVKTNLTIEQDEDGFYNLTVTTDNKNFNGVASIKVSYNSNLKKNFFKSLDFNHYIYVDDITLTSIQSADLHTPNFNIPKNSNEYYIPITILNGVGEVSIKKYPVKNTNLVINDASVVDVFDVNFKYSVASKDEFEDEKIVYVDKSVENRIILKNAKQIKNNKNVAKILKYEESGNYIKLHIDKKASLFKYPYYFEVS